jgi:hypothetical protein
MVHRVELLDVRPVTEGSGWRSEHWLPTAQTWSVRPEGPIWIGSWRHQRWQQVQEPVTIQAPLQQMYTVLLPPSSSYTRKVAPLSSVSGREGTLDAAEEPSSPLVAQALGHYQQQPMPIAALAAKCHVSERTLHRAFHSAYGAGPRQVLRAVRLRGVLARTGIPRAVGEDLFPYVDYSHFFREFVALTGLRPSQLQSLRHHGSPDPDCLNGT